jgi:hypothetical protein
MRNIYSFFDKHREKILSCDNENCIVSKKNLEERIIVEVLFIRGSIKGIEIASQELSDKFSSKKTGTIVKPAFALAAEFRGPYILTI